MTYKYFFISFISFFLFQNTIFAGWYDEDLDAQKVIQRIKRETEESSQIYAQKIAEDFIMLKKPFNGTEWQLITVEEQTGGIGQSSRGWISPPNVNIYATYMIPWPQEKLALLFHLPQIVTLAIAESVETFGVTPQIKWVNDLLLNKKKVCGILCQNRGQIINSTLSVVLIGVGINVNMTEEDCSKIDQPVTSLMLQNQAQLDKEEVLTAVNKHLFKTVREFLKIGFNPFFPAIQKRMAFINEEIQFEDGKEIYKGIFKGINEDGEIILQTEDGEKTFNTGRILRQKS